MNQPNRRTVLKGAAAAAFLAATRSQFAGAQESDDVRTIEAVNGTIEIEGTPERVVGLEYELVENLVILGVEPVGVAERDSISVWVPLPEPLSESIVDVGTRDELNIEALIELEPDLIIAASPRQDAALENLEAVAKTVQLQTYSPRFTPEGITAHDHFKQVLTQVATAVNKEAEAEAAIAEFDELLAAGTTAVAETDFAGRPFVFAAFNDFTQANLFNEHSRIAYTIGQLGLVNQAGENTETPGLHFETRSVEVLGELPAETVFIVSVSAAAADAAEEFYSGDLWQSMPFVQAGNFINLGEPNIWAAGSAITLSNLIERVVPALGGTLE